MRSGRSRQDGRGTSVRARPDESRLVWWPWALPAAVALAASLAGVLNQFVIDDVSLIEHNARAHSLLNWRELLTSPYWPPPFAPELFRPVTSLLMALEYALGGGGPLVFRIVSYGLYAACAVGVLALASRLLSRRVAVGTAVLFAAHPLHVEAVALGVNQAELLVALIAVVIVCRYVDVRRAGPVPVREWATFAALYAAAALIKENAFILPGLLLAAEWLLVPEVAFVARVRALWRGYAVLAGVGALLLLARGAVLSGNVGGAISAEALAGLGIGGRTLTMLQVVPTLLRLMAWPAHLQVDYSPDEIVASTSFGAREAAGLCLVLVALATAFAVRRRAPAASFGLAWCAVALLPVSNVFVPTGIVLAERTLFLPSVGFVLAVGAAAERLMAAASAPRARTHMVLAGLCGALALAGIARSAERHRAWRNSAHLWLVSSRDAPRSKRIKQVQRDAIAALVQEYEAAIVSAGKPWPLRNALALRLRLMGDDTAAVTQLRLSLSENGNQVGARVDLASALLALGRYGEARRVADSAIVAGDPAPAFRTLRDLADSAEAAHAPAGSVRLAIPAGPDSPGIEPRRAPGGAGARLP